MSEIEARTPAVNGVVSLVRTNPVVQMILLTALAVLFTGATGVSLTYGIEVLVFALAAYGVHLLYGYTGLLSFGHAAFFGSGAYVATMGLTEFNLGVFAMLLVVVVVCVIIAAIIGFFSIQQYGIYFAILTLAFGEILHFLVTQTSELGGADGLIGLSDRPPANLAILWYDLNPSMNLFLFVAGVTTVLIFLLYRLINSQLGSAFIAVRENEDRARAIGYDVQRIKFTSFIISGAVTGIAGGLYALYLGVVSPELLNWTRSGDFLFIIILGGIYTFLGPVIGAVMYLGIREGVGNVTDRWQFFVGLLFLLLVHYAPEDVGILVREKADFLRQRIYS